MRGAMLSCASFFFFFSCFLLVAFIVIIIIIIIVIIVILLGFISAFVLCATKRQSRALCLPPPRRYTDIYWKEMPKFIRGAEITTSVTF